MAIPRRNSQPIQIQAALRTFFVSTSAWQSRYLFQSHRMARLLVDVLQHYRTEKKYLLHEFVVMPNHLHLLLTVTRDMSIEKAVQLIKGGFSYRVNRELQFRAPVWHRGFSEVRIYSHEAFLARKRYIQSCSSAIGSDNDRLGVQFGATGVFSGSLSCVPQGLKPRGE